MAKGAVDVEAHRKASRKAEIRALDAAIDSVFLGADPGPSCRPPASVGRTNRGGGGNVDNAYEIQLQKLSQHSFTSSPPSHYESLPSYPPPNANPRYGSPYQDEEPVTLARRLFFYGFFFFPFWIAGFAILFAKPRAGEWVATDATPAEQERFVIALRQTEVKWARRCGFAFISLVFIIVSVVISLKFSILRPI